MVTFLTPIDLNESNMRKGVWVLDFHSCCVVSTGLVVFWVLSAIEFSICEKRKRKGVEVEVEEGGF